MDSIFTCAALAVKRLYTEAMTSVKAYEYYPAATLRDALFIRRNSHLKTGKKTLIRE
jgi:hypothetical protein